MLLTWLLRMPHYRHPANAIAGYDYSVTEPEGIIKVHPSYFLHVFQHARLEELMEA